MSRQAEGSAREESRRMRAFATEAIASGGGSRKHVPVASQTTFMPAITAALEARGDLRRPLVEGTLSFGSYSGAAAIVRVLQVIEDPRNASSYPASHTRASLRQNIE